MNTKSRSKTRGLFQLFLLTSIAGLIFLALPLQTQAGPGGPTETPTSSSTPWWPTDTPVPQVTPEVTVTLSTIIDLATQAVQPEPVATEEALQDTPGGFSLNSLFGINQCLIALIVLSLIAITVMVLYQVVQRMRA